jgi:cell division protein FtsL
MKSLRKIVINFVLAVVGFNLAANLVSQVKTVVNAKRLVSNLEERYLKLKGENQELEKKIKEAESPEARLKLQEQVKWLLGE